MLYPPPHKIPSTCHAFNATQAQQVFLLRRVSAKTQSRAHGTLVTDRPHREPCSAESRRRQRISFEPIITGIICEDVAKTFRPSSHSDARVAVNLAQLFALLTILASRSAANLTGQYAGIAVRED